MVLLPATNTINIFYLLHPTIMHNTEEEDIIQKLMECLDISSTALLDLKSGKWDGEEVEDIVSENNRVVALAIEEYGQHYPDVAGPIL
jgi:hypothetical protein